MSSESTSDDPTTWTITRLWNEYGGFPWCDVCKRSAAFSEFYGNRHRSTEFPFGIPEHLDKSGHVVTMREWYDVPSGGPSEESTSDKKEKR